MQNLKKLNNLKNNDFSLVLSGGGALGFYYLGVFKALEEKNLFPKEIIGTSMGAILGSIWALGHNTDEIIDLIEETFLDKNLIFKDFSKFFRKHYEKFLVNRCFNDLRFEFTGVMTDVEKSEPKKFSKEDGLTLRDVVFGASAIPNKFEPIKFKNNHYYDGYFTSNFPVEFANCENILGVDVLSGLNLGAFKFSNLMLLSKKQNSFNITYRSLFNLIKKDSIKKAKEVNCIYITPKNKISNIFNYQEYHNLYKKGYDDMIAYFNL